MALVLVICGAAGRMGGRLIALAGASPQFRVAAALDAPGSARLGQDAGELAGIGRIGVPIAATCDAPFDVMVDFSTPAGTDRAVECCLAAGRPLVCGTTGLQPHHLHRIEEAAARIPVLHAANMSLGVQVLLGTVREMVRRLGPDFDVEIVETHHRGKIDAPSGTANALVDAVQQGREMNRAGAGEVIHGRSGPAGPRPAGQIGVHAVRSGEVAGRHDVLLGGPGESLLLRHEAHSRDIFARGALRAAGWIAGRPPGRYTMAHVLGLD